MYVRTLPFSRRYTDAFRSAGLLLAAEKRKAISLAPTGVGAFLGTLLAATFYKFLKYLEFETVIGPEQLDAPASSSTNDQSDESNAEPDLVAFPAMILAAGASAATRTTPTAATTSMGEKEVHPTGQKGTLAIQGPGLPNLLATGPVGSVFDLLQPPHDYRTRLERNESLLEALAGVAGAHGRKLSTEGTVVGIDETRHEWHETNDSPV
ncbi:hypothetical protein JCM10295v2_002653 [Rhodotorula toruloides]